VQAGMDFPMECFDQCFSMFSMGPGLGGRGAGFKEVVLVPLLSKVGQGDQQQGAPGGKRVAIKNPQWG
jgi:hypothetical protein